MNWKRSVALAALVLGSSAFAANKTSPSPYYTEPSKWKQSPGEIRDSLNINVGGGIEGYTGDLNNRINPGPAWVATIGVQPLSFMGAELGYIGSVSEVDNRVLGGDGIANGADFVHNGGQVNATFNIPTPFLQPYALVGIGIDWYNVRNDVVGNAAGFRDDVAGRVPLGGGLKAKVGPLNADARFVYDALFSDQVSSPGGTRTTGGAYDALLQLGGRF